MFNPKVQLGHVELSSKYQVSTNLKSSRAFFMQKNNHDCCQGVSQLVRVNVSPLVRHYVPTHLFCSLRRVICLSISLGSRWLVLPPMARFMLRGKDMSAVIRLFRCWFTSSILHTIRGFIYCQHKHVQPKLSCPKDLTHGKNRYYQQALIKSQKMEKCLSFKILYTK